MSVKTPQYFRVRNFDQFQHYSKRNPPWIRLYYRLLHDRNFYRLSDENKYLCIGLFLLASQHENKVDFDREWIKKELSLSKLPDLQAIEDAKFIKIHYASAMLARHTKKSSHIITDNSDNSLQIAHSTPEKKNSPGNLFTELPCSGKVKTFQVSKNYISEMQELYPGVNIENETLKAKGWLVNNPKRQKTHDGMTRFLGNWYSRAQNNGKPQQQNEPSSLLKESYDDEQDGDRLCK